jgi:hypothetical protein
MAPPSLLERATCKEQGLTANEIVPNGIGAGTQPLRTGVLHSSSLVSDRSQNVIY